MKKYVPFLLAGALAMPAFGLAAQHVGAQDGPRDGQCDHGGRGGHGGHHGRDGGPGAREGHEGRGGHRGHHGDPSARAEHRTRMLTAILDLNERQATEVRRILTAEATEMQNLRQQGRSETTRDAMRALHERTKTSIAAVLNPQQRATMQRVEAARQANHAERENRRNPEASPARPAR